MVQLSTSWTKLNTYTVDTYGFKGEFALWAKISETDIAGNRTKVSYDWDFTLTYGWQTSYDAQDYVTGAGWNEATYREYSSSGTLRSGSEWINHADDGTGSGTGYGRTRMGGMNFDTDWVAGSFTLPTIARASLPSVSPNPITLSSNTNTLTVATNRKSSSFTHDITCTIGSYTETKTGITDTTTFDIPKTILSDFTATSKTLEGTITCVTKNGATNIGTKSVNFNAQIDETQEHPSITSVTLTDTNPNSAAIEAQGSYIKYATNLSASIALGVTGSYTELASAVVQCGTKQQTYALSGTSQTITFTYDKLDADALIITVYDKRGTTATQTKTWTLIPYRDITVTGSVDRMSETGNTISFSLSGACFGGSFGNATNTVTVSYKYKLHTASTWSDGTQTFTFTPSGSGETTYSYSNTLTGFAYDQQYDLQFTVTDMFTFATTRTLVLTVGIPVYGNGEDFFAVYGKSYLHFDRDNPNKFWDLKEGLDAILQYHAQTNLLTIECETSTVGGITYTVNDDGTIRAQGTSTGSLFRVGTAYGLKKGELWYYFTGCPSGGSSSTYYTGYETQSIPISTDESITLLLPADTGNGDTLADYGVWGATTPYYIYIASGQTVDLTFKPMIRDIRIASDSYVSAYPQIFTADWTASTSSGLNAVLTDRVTIPSGTYLVYVHRPTCSTSMFSLCVRANGSDYNNYLTNTQFESICAIQRYTGTTYLEVCATTSASATFSNLERGKLIVAKIG